MLGSAEHDGKYADLYGSDWIDLCAGVWDPIVWNWASPNSTLPCSRVHCPSAHSTRIAHRVPERLRRNFYRSKFDALWTAELAHNNLRGLGSYLYFNMHSALVPKCTAFLEERRKMTTLLIVLLVLFLLGGGGGIFSLARVAPTAKVSWSETSSADAGCTRRVISIRRVMRHSARCGRGPRCLQADRLGQRAEERLYRIPETVLVESS